MFGDKIKIIGRDFWGFFILKLMNGTLNASYFTNLTDFFVSYLYFIWTLSEIQIIDFNLVWNYCK